jgi:integrase/recombinase XerC
MLSFEENTQKFLTYLKLTKNASIHTIRNYGIDLKSFKNYVLQEAGAKEEPPKDFSLETVDKKVVRRYLSHLNAAQKSKKTIVRQLASLRSLFQFLSKEKLLEINPMEEISSPKLEKKIPNVLTYDQIERLFALPDLDTYLGFRDRCIMEVFYSCGIRISELVGLNRSHFDAGNLCLRILGKGKKERIVPITKSAAGWLSTYLTHPLRNLESDIHKPEQDSFAIFLNKWGKRITTRSVDRKFDEYLKRSGLSGKITPHTIRHTIATHWLENGMDLKTIQVLLGHSSLNTTTIYTKVSTTLQRDVYERTHPLEKKNRGNDKPDFGP